MCSDCFFVCWQTPRSHPVLPLHSSVRPGAVLSAVRLGHGPAGWTAHQHRKHEPQTAGPGPGPVPLSETGSYGVCVRACVPKRWLEWYLWKWLLERKSGISFATFSIVLYHLCSTRNTTTWLLKEHCIAVCSAVSVHLQPVETSIPGNTQPLGGHLSLCVMLLWTSSSELPSGS